MLVYMYTNITKCPFPGQNLDLGITHHTLRTTLTLISNPNPNL